MSQDEVMVGEWQNQTSLYTFTVFENNSNIKPETNQALCVNYFTSACFLFGVRWRENVFSWAKTNNRDMLHHIPQRWHFNMHIYILNWSITVLMGVFTIMILISNVKLLRVDSVSFFSFGSDRVSESHIHVHDQLSSDGRHNLHLVLQHSASEHVGEAKQTLGSRWTSLHAGN